MAAKRGFQYADCARMPKRERTVKFPKASEVKENVPKENIPYTCGVPKSILNQIGDPKMVMAFKIETHGWPAIQSEKGHIGRFGFYTLKDHVTIAYARVVRIGWVTGGSRKDAPTVSKCYIVCPDEFEIEKKSIEFHGITTEKATLQGASSSEVLNEFVKDAMTVCNQGGIVTAHRIEFEAGIIYEELRRCGLYKLQEQWNTIVRRGFCAMDPSFGRWLLQCHGEDVGPDTVQHALGFKKVVDLILPQQYKPKHQDTEYNVKLCWMIFVELMEKVRVQKNDQP